jgi:hypothetical protein
MLAVQPSDYKQIIRHLAEGIDPTTGEVLEGSGPLNSPVVIRALYSLLAETEGKTRRTRSERSMPENFGKPWSEADRTYLQQSYLGGVPEAELAQTLKRTKGGISSELIRLGLKEAPNSTPGATGMREPEAAAYSFEADETAIQETRNIEHCSNNDLHPMTN